MAISSAGVEAATSAIETGSFESAVVEVAVAAAEVVEVAAATIMEVQKGGRLLPSLKSCNDEVKIAVESMAVASKGMVEAAASAVDGDSVASEASLASAMVAAGIMATSAAAVDTALKAKLE
jgi:hypothetical protein